MLTYDIPDRWIEHARNAAEGFHGDPDDSPPSDGTEKASGFGEEGECVAQRAPRQDQVRVVRAGLASVVGYGVAGVA